MLAQNHAVEEIAKLIRVSKTTVERVRADYNALTFKTALSKLSPGDWLDDIQYKQAEIRARGVRGNIRRAIIAGIVDARLKVTDILDPVPTDSRLALAPQDVDPEHDPVRLAKRHKLS
jgi:hypothetical protein